MNVGIPREVTDGETRVAVIPAMVSILTKQQHAVFVEKGAGERTFFPDSAYAETGATLVDGADALYRSADVILKVQPPRTGSGKTPNELKRLKKGATLISFLAPLQYPELIRGLAERQITSFAMEFIPRITRAQSMDALSSMATLAGYKAVLLAADHLGKIFPLMMTAAGTIPPATVLVLGAGVAGLQAIATARRLGAKVEAFDPRPVVKEQVQSLGAAFIDMETPEDAETTGGYAKELPEDFLKREQDAIAARLSRVDAVVTTAQIFGKKAPILITKDMVEHMRPGSVIVDLAAEQGGNCELTRAGDTVVHAGITIMGPVNLPAALPVHASQMYSKNITNLFRHLFPEADSVPDFSDEIAAGACLTREGEIVNEFLKKLPVFAAKQ